MEFIAVAYVCTLLILLPWLLKGAPVWVRWILLAMNVWLPLYSFSLARIWWQLIQLARMFPSKTGTPPIQWYEWLDSFLIQQLVIIFLPILFFWNKWRGNLLLSIFLGAIIYIYHPYHNWNLFRWEQGLCIWISLLFISFAALWLTQQIPDKDAITHV